MQRIAEYLKERNIPKDSLEANSILEGYELGAERTKRDMIEKACKWLYVYYPTFERSKSFEDAWEHFKQAMQDENKDI